MWHMTKKLHVSQNSKNAVAYNSWNLVFKKIRWDNILLEANENKIKVDLF